MKLTKYDISSIIYGILTLFCVGMLFLTSSLPRGDGQTYLTLIAILGILVYYGRLNVIGIYEKLDKIENRLKTEDGEG